MLVAQLTNVHCVFDLENLKPLLVAQFSILFKFDNAKINLASMPNVNRFFIGILFQGNDSLCNYVVGLSSSRNVTIRVKNPRAIDECVCYYLTRISCNITLTRPCKI